MLRRLDAPAEQPISAFLRLLMTSDWLTATSLSTRPVKLRPIVIVTVIHPQSVRLCGTHLERRGERFGHGSKSQTRRAWRSVRRLQHGVQIVRHRGDPRRSGAGAVEVHGCGAADFTVYHVQAARTRKPRCK